MAVTETQLHPACIIVYTLENSYKRLSYMTTHSDSASLRVGRDPLPANLLLLSSCNRCMARLFPCTGMLALQLAKSVDTLRSTYSLHAGTTA